MTPEESPPPILILNPSAGAALDDPQLLTRLNAHPALRGVETVLTHQDRDVRTLAGEARDAGREKILVGGGDGTIHGAVNGILEGLDPHALPSADSLPILSVLPMGTGNDLARSLGLPLDPWKALDELDWNRVRPVDLIRTEGEIEGWCINVISGGLAEKEGMSRDGSGKTSLGTMAYWRRGILTMTDEHEPYALSLVLDGDTRMEFRAQDLVLGNGRYAGGGIPVAPEASLDDGRLDLLLVPELERAEMGLLMPRLVLGTHHRHERILFKKIRNLELEAEPPLHLSLDGELTRAGAVAFRVVPEGLRVVVGSGEDLPGFPREDPRDDPQEEPQEEPPTD